MDLQLLLKEYGVADETSLLKAKNEGNQQKLFSVKAPSVVMMTSDECKRACDKIGVKYFPGYEKRVLDYTISTEDRDRAGDVCRAKGCTFENYMKNPVVFFSHQYATPIGNSLRAWHERSDKTVRAWGLLVDDNIDTTGLSDLVFRFASNGFMKACSVGFKPIKANFPKDQLEAEKLGVGKYGAEYVEWELLEWSPCGVPMNPNALQAAMKSIDLNKLHIEKRDLDLLQRVRFFDDAALDRFESMLKGDVTVSVSVANTETGNTETEAGNTKAPEASQEAPVVLATPAPVVVNVNIDKSFLEGIVNLQTSVKELAALVTNNSTASPATPPKKAIGLYSDTSAPALNLFSDFQITN